MFANNKKPSSKTNNSSTKSPIISHIPPSNNLEKITSSFENIVQPSPYDTKPQLTTTKKIPPPLSSTTPTSSTAEPDPTTKITRTTTTTTVTTVTTTTISAKNSPGQGPLYLDFGDFSLSPIEPDKLGSNGDDATNKNLSQPASQKTTGPALVSLDNNISVNDPSSITIVSSKTSTDPVKIKEEFEQISPTSSSSSNTLSSDSPRPFPSARPTLKGYQKVPHLDNSDPRRQPHHYLKRIESAPVIPNLSINNNEMYDSFLLSTKSMSNLNKMDPKSTTPLENKSSTETPKQYLERMQYTLSKSKLATMLAKKSDSFHQAVLKEYMNAFDFDKDPIDIALRKFLMECHLPKETQQIDRVMESFAKKYFDSNPDLFSSPGM
ncbi:20446_t:CDS:2 [Funneliformis geosporum]|uniref:17066_t:CDS:1 n=1 Tax=Funneliformis geosporum TaxID=1117311 RepID=A0A9W4SIC8_9GLOM|nr:20446_t:CDS:2 [Funneliformis geosporum]CAI2170868.1 17066_t:CDS:2 [Funneliformis geosporum]